MRVPLNALNVVFIFVFLVIQKVAFTQTNCNSWLSVSSLASGIEIGDLDVSGNVITVEAKFNRTQPYNGPRVFAGDIVSKHLSLLYFFHKSRYQAVTTAQIQQPGYRKYWFERLLFIPN